MGRGTWRRLSKALEVYMYGIFLKANFFSIEMPIMHVPFHTHYEWLK